MRLHSPIFHNCYGRSNPEDELGADSSSGVAIKASILAGEVGEAEVRLKAVRSHETEVPLETRNQAELRIKAQ
jgi:hypothetical protein